MPNTPTFVRNFVFAAVLALLLAAVPGSAQTPPCGRGELKMGGSATELQFFPASVEHVRASVLRALPAMAAIPTKEKDGVIEAKFDMSLSGSSSTIYAGSSGKFIIALKPTKYAGVAGTLVSIDFQKGWVGALASSDKYATPLAEEVGCLVGLLSPVDPASNPRGQTSVSQAAGVREISVPAKIGLKIALRNYLTTYSKYSGITSGTMDPKQPVFEVIEDVVVDGATVFRKGALAKGKIIQMLAAQHVQRAGWIQLTIESATAVDGQDIAVEGGPVKEQGRGARATKDTTIVFGVDAAIILKGQEALIPSGTTYEVQVVAPANVKVEAESAKPVASQVATIKSDSPPGLNIEGAWYAPKWGDLRFLQAPGEREVIGKGGGYDIDGVVNESKLVLHFTSEGERQYSAELTPKEDNNTLSGIYVSGEMGAGSKSQKIEMTRILNIAAGKNDPPPALNVEGTWNSPGWGKIQLTQAAGDREVTGKRRGYEIDGYVTGTRVVLHFMSGANVSYSVELSPKGDDALSGRYSEGQMFGNSKTLPFEMTRQK